MRLTHARHAREGTLGAPSSEESSTAATSSARRALAVAFTASSRTCSIVPKGTTIDFGSRIQARDLTAAEALVEREGVDSLGADDALVERLEGDRDRPQNGMDAS